MVKNIGKIFPVLVVLLAVALLARDARTSGDPAVTQPTTVPASTAGDTAEPTSVSTMAPVRSGTVEEILEENWLDETALSVCVFDSALLEQKAVRGLGKHANGFELANLCDEQRMNPVAAFWLLVEEGLYEKTPDDSGVLPTPAFNAPETEGKTYPNTAEGARELLTDLLHYAGEVSDGLDLEKRVLGSDGEVNADQVFEVPGECRYAYFVYYGDRTAHFLCCYLRGEENITDVEFQLLNLRYAEGPEDSLRELDERTDRQAAALMATTELLMTGSSRANQGHIPFDYNLVSQTVHLDRFTFTGGAETGTLTNYRIKK